MIKKHKKITNKKARVVIKCRNKKKNKSNKLVKKQIINKVKIPETVPILIISENIKLPRKRKRKQSNNTNTPRMYFTQETEDAIIAYNKEENKEIREKIFEGKILYPFQKLVENVFNTFKFSYFETSPQDVQKECLTHLVANIHKYDPSRCSKTDPNKKTRAFAYFSIIAKHYLILLNNTNYKKFNQNIEISEERDENTVQLQADDKYYAQKELTDFISLIIEFWERNVNAIFTKQRDLNIANAVVELFRKSDRIDVFNKKALYLCIREIASCKTQQITKVINKMKQYHNNIQRSYIEEGKVNMERNIVS